MPMTEVKHNVDQGWYLQVVLKKYERRVVLLDERELIRTCYEHVMHVNMIFDLMLLLNTLTRHVHSVVTHYSTSHVCLLQLTGMWCPHSSDRLLLL